MKKTSLNRVWHLGLYSIVLSTVVTGCEKKGTESAPAATSSAAGGASPTARVAPAAEASKSAETKEVPKKEEAKPAESAAQPPASATPASGTSDATKQPWKVPAGWTFDATPKPMRVATYIAPTASGNVEVAVTRFPGKVGGELANINRWRGQMGLPTIDASGLDATLTRFSAAGFEGYETRIESEKGVMLASAVFESASDQTWFVRATAKDGKRAEEIKSSVFGMARSIMESKSGK